MNNLEQIVTVPVIIAIVYGFFAIYKKIVTKEKYIRLIPLLASILGAILGITGYVYTDIMPCDNVLTAILVGAASGFAATGINQLTKQWSKPDGNTKKDNDNGEAN